MKLGTIIDSSAGLSKAEANKRGWGFLPLYITIDDVEYGGGVNLDSKSYYEKITLESDVRTSATPPGQIEEVLKKMSKDNDYVIVYALSTKLSSQTNNITLIAKDYDNVFVVPSFGVGMGIVRDVEVLNEMADSGSTWEEIKAEAVDLTKSLFGVIAPVTMKWLVKGGRIGPAASGMANLLKVVPLISLKDGGLEKYGKGRVFKKAVLKFTKDLYDQFGDTKEYILLNANNPDIKEIQTKMEEIVGTVIYSDFPSVIVNHIGPGAVALLTRKKR